MPEAEGAHEALAALTEELIAKRKEMAEVFVKTQNRMSSTCDELDQLIRAPIPYVSKFEGDCEIETPYPRDGHMVRTSEVVKKRPLKPFDARAVPFTEVTGGKPWYTHTHTYPTIFDPHAVHAEKKEAAGSSAMDMEMWRTRHNEWTLQKNAYNPDIASQMRTNVRKAAALTSAKQETSEHDEKASDLRASHQVKLALTDSTVVGQDPPRPKEKVTLAAVWPYGRSREGKDL